ncbi:MAG: FAD-binding protein [Erysipelotrichaceae bacterium]
MAEKGVDEDFNKPAANLVALDAAPYYAVKFYPTTFGSQGGVLTDEGGRCLNANNEAIVGLYAAGADSNRYYYNENYVLAASLGIYATTGRLTGMAAAADIKQGCFLMFILRIEKVDL